MIKKFGGNYDVWKFIISISYLYMLQHVYKRKSTKAIERKMDIEIIGKRERQDYFGNVNETEEWENSYMFEEL